MLKLAKVPATSQARHEVFAARVTTAIVAPLRANEGQLITWVVGGPARRSLAVVDPRTRKIVRMANSDMRTALLITGLVKGGAMEPLSTRDASALRTFVGECQ